MDDAARSQTIARIARRLEGFDDLALRELDRLTDAATYAAGAREGAPLEATDRSAPDDGREGRGDGGRDGQRDDGGLSRRHLVTGGAVVGLGALLTALAVTGDRARLAIARGAEIDRLRELLGLHGRLEGLGLDGRLRTALATVAAAASVARGLAGALKAGLDLVEAAVALFERALEPIEAGLVRLAAIVNALALALEILGRTLQAGAEPVALAAADFVERVLSRLPFGFAEEAQAALEAMRELVDLAPDTVVAARDGVVAPLREYWLPEADSGEPGLRGRLLDPLRSEVIPQARGLGRAIEAWQAAWRDEIDQAVLPILDERAELRAQIATMEQELGLRVPGTVG